MTHHRTLRRLMLRHATAGAAVLGLAACAGMPQSPPAMATQATPATLYAEGKQHFQAGRLGLALDAFQAAHRIDPQSVEVLNGIGAAYDRMGRPVLAEQAYLDALALAPSDPATLNNIGWSRHLRGQSAVAAFYLSRAVALAPDDPVMQANLAQIEAQGGVDPQAPPVDLREATSHMRIERRSATEQMLMTAALPPARLPGTEDEQDILELRTQGTATPEQNAASPAPPVGAAGRATAAGQEGPAAREAAPSLPAPSLPLEGPLDGVEVSNGTGRRLMATRVGAWLADHAVTVARRTNADTFTYRRSVILYSAAASPAAARALAGRLPGPVDIRAAGPDQTSPLRLVLGADLLDFDHQLVASQRSSRDA